MADHKTTKFFIIFAGIVILALVLKTLEGFMFPFALSIIFTLLILPLVKVSKKIKVPFWIFGTGIAVGVILVTMTCISLLTLEGKSLVDNIPAYKEQVNSFYNIYTGYATSYGFEPIELGTFINFDVIKNISTLVLQSIGNILFNVFLGLIITVFLITSYQKLIKTLEKTEGKVKKQKFEKGLFKIEKSIRDYILTKSLISFGTAFFSGLALFFFGGDFVFILSFLFFALNFIPNIGSIAAVAMALVLFTLKVGLGWNVLILGGIFILIQLIFGFIIEPKFTGEKMSMSPILVLFSLFIWGWIWGIGGMILAVPLTSILKIILEHVDATKGYCKFLN